MPLVCGSFEVGCGLKLAFKTMPTVVELDYLDT